MGEIVPMKEQRLQTRLDVEIQKQLKRFRLDVKLQADGGCLGILGPSGCGKSMTLKSIAGIVTPDEGLISIQKGTEQRILFDKSQKVNIKPQKTKNRIFISELCVVSQYDCSGKYRCGTGMGM